MSNDDLCDSVFGHFEKSKIRIRVYPPDLDRVILELKEKKGFDGVKTQVEITNVITSYSIHYTKLYDTGL